VASNSIQKPAVSEQQPQDGNEGRAYIGNRAALPIHAIFGNTSFYSVLTRMYWLI